MDFFRLINRPSKETILTKNPAYKNVNSSAINIPQSQGI